MCQKKGSFQSFYFVSDSSEVINLLFFFHTFLLKSSFVSVFEHVFRQYVLFTYQIWNHNFLFRKFIRFPDFPGFSGFNFFFHFIFRFRIFMILPVFPLIFRYFSESLWYWMISFSGIYIVLDFFGIFPDNFKYSAFTFNKFFKFDKMITNVIFFPIFF